MPERLPPVLQRMLAMWNGETVDPAGVYAFRCVQDSESTFGPADVAADVRVLRAGIPDLHFEVDDWFAADTRYVLRMRACGTHSGLLTTPIGLAHATGVAIAMRGIEVFEIDDDRIVGVWLGWNWGDVFANLGARLPANKA